MTPYLFYGILGGVWLVSLVVAGLAVRWSFLSERRRFLPALILSLAALLVAYYGMRHFQFNGSQTVNGVVKWHFDSRWLFEVSLALGTFALVNAIWKKTRGNVLTG